MSQSIDAASSGRVAGGVSSIIGFVTATALATVSLIVCLNEDVDDIGLDRAREAARAAGPEAPVVVTVDAEELVWASRGQFRLLAPWEPAPPTPYTAIARDPSGLPPEGEDGVGPLSIVEPWFARRYGQGAPAPWGADLLDRLDRAVVTVGAGEGARTCAAWRADRWFCGPKSWNYVGPQEIEVEGKRQTCLWLHPMEGGEALRVAFSDLPPGGTLRGRFALSDEAAATAGGAEIRFKVEVDGEVTVERIHPNRPGWSSFRVDLNRPAPVEVAFVVSADHTGRRHFCLTAALEKGVAP